MVYSVNDLAEMTLQELGVLDTGQPVSAEDANLIFKRLPSILADLNARDVGFIHINNIEDAVALPLAQIVAYNSYNAFNISDNTQISKLGVIGGKDGEAERTIRNIRRLRTPRQTMRVEQYSRYRYGRYGW